MVAILVIGALVLIGYIAYTVWQWHRLSHIPGPFIAGWSKLWMIKEGLKGRQLFSLHKVTDQYGSLARIGPNHLVTDDPEVLRRTMAVRSEYSKGPWYGAYRLEPGKDTLFTTRDDVAHAALRNKMAAGYSGKENESMEATIDKQIARLIQLIETKYISTSQMYKPVDFAAKVQYFTLDVISDLAFGRPLGYLEKDTDLFDYIKITSAYLLFADFLGNVPSVTKLLHSKLFRGLVPAAGDKLGFGAFIGVAKQAVAERFARLEDKSRRSDMLGSFIRHGLTQDEASSEVLLQVLAGSHTSALTIRVVLLSLLTSPPAYKTLQNEIDTAVDAGHISAPITDAEGRQLPYLQAVIREALRIKPPATGYMFKLVPAGGDTIHGKFVPAGTQITSSPFGLHHSKKIFGPDAEMFRPERWLETDTERLSEMTSTNDLIFHYGKFQCPGKSVAMMEFNKIFVELLRRFEFSIIHPEKPARFFPAGFWLVEDFWVRVTQRE